MGTLSQRIVGIGMIVRIRTISIFGIFKPRTECVSHPYKNVSPANGQTFTINVTIENGHNVGGYQFSVIYDANVIRYAGSANQDYLPDGAFPIPP